MSQELLTNENRQGGSAQKLANLFLCLALLVGFLLIFLEPPFVCPDENAHFMNICRISHGGLFADVNDGVSGSYMTVEEFVFLRDYGGRYNGAEAERFDWKTSSALSSIEPSEEMIFVPSHLSEINPTSYVLPAVLIMILRFFGIVLNGYNTLLIAKLFNLVFYALVIRLAILKTGALRNTMFLLALMPMSIFQGASTSYDAYLISCSFLLFAYVTKILLESDDYRITRGDLIAVAFSSVFIVNCKIAYAPLLLILLAIPIKKFGSLNRYFACIGIVVGAVGLCYLIPTIVNGINTKDVVRVVKDEVIQHQELFYADVTVFPNVVISTIKHFGPYWMESFFGILGWLDTRFPLAFVLLFFLISTLSAITEVSELKGIRWNTRLLSAGGVLIFLLGSIYVMYVTWTPDLTGIVGGVLAYGCQGRYFIPVALFVVLAFANPLMKKIKVFEKIAFVREQTVCMTAIVYLAATVLLITVRYWC
ncbi:MAG: DUF2142 domain-containing protein [Clostridia bacterium]|nr:DUF2142 domain-containing protein [Clostridia bacterium]